MITKSLQKFLEHDLPQDSEVGMILFDKVVKLEDIRGPDKVANIGLNLVNSLPIALNLESNNDSCVRCAIRNVPSTALGASIIVITQAKPFGISKQEIDDIIALAEENKWKIFVIAISKEPASDLDLTWEETSFRTGGASFFIVPKQVGVDRKMPVFVGLVDALREIQDKTTGNGPSLVSY